MTEREYILVGDLKVIRCASRLLSSLVPANNPHVKAVKLRQMLAELDRWDEAITDGLQVDEDEP